MRTFLQAFSHNAAVDLGTANTLLYVPGKGVVAQEPSYIAVHRDGPNVGKIEAFGADAKNLRGRTSANIVASSPLRGGAIQDYDLAEELLRYFFKKIPSRSRLLRSKIVIGVPCNATEVEQRAVIEAAEAAGGGKVYLVEEAMAAAIGAGLPVAEPTGSMILDIGGGTTDLAVVSLGGVVYSHSIKTAGDTFDEKIVEFVRKKYSIAIGEQTAENAKLSVGAAQAGEQNPAITVQGQDLAKGRPAAVQLSREEIVKAISDPLKEIVDMIKRALDHTPPEIAADLVDSGLVMVGGGALLQDLDLFLTEKTGLAATVAEDPLTAVVTGSGKILEEWEKYEHLLCHV